MLKIKKKAPSRTRQTLLSLIAIGMLAGGAYMLTLVAAPIAAPVITMKPIDVNSLPQPAKQDNRIVIPKIGVNIAYGPNEASLDRGAWWRHSDRGNPSKGGNFIIAAHRFSIQPTPQSTIEKSPFYNIDKLVIGDKIVVDYEGQRYGYEVEKITDVKPTQIEIEAPTETPRLTLYSCELGGAEAGRIVLFAKPLGLVALNS